MVQYIKISVYTGSLYPELTVVTAAEGLLKTALFKSSASQIYPGCYKEPVWP